MATFNNHQITVVKDNGLVSTCSPTHAAALAGSLVIGHTRYSTSARRTGPRPSRLPLGRLIGLRPRP